MADELGDGRFAQAKNMFPAGAIPRELRATLLALEGLAWEIRRLADSETGTDIGKGM